MNKETKIKKLIIVVLTIFLLTVFLSGCTENNSTNDKVDLNKFIGTWSGNMKTSFLGFRGNNPPMNNTNILENDTNRNFTNFRENNTIVNINKLVFTSDTLSMTITTVNNTQTIYQKYTLDGDQLVLSFQFNGEQSINRPKFNDTGEQRPPFDNRSKPLNGSEPPYGGERPPFNGEQPSITTTYNYSFNEDYSILYLDGSPFIKN